MKRISFKEDEITPGMLAGGEARVSEGAETPGAYVDSEVFAAICFVSDSRDIDGVYE